MANADHFLDSHPDIAQQLRKDPSLINNHEYLESHPALQEYLKEHPGVREEWKENPQVFMRQENRYDRVEEGRERDRDNDGRQVANADQFLDSHPEISEQLRKDPTLINNQQFLKNHPALQEYLKEHPGVREEWKENPQGFMRQENRYDRFEGRERDGDNDRRQVANADQFLDSHPEIGEQLRKNPSLINNEEFVENHPALREYLQSHPGIREEMTENPQAFMRAVEQWDRQDKTSVPSPDR